MVFQEDQGTKNLHALLVGAIYVVTVMLKLSFLGIPQQMQEVMCMNTV